MSSKQYDMFEDEGSQTMTFTLPDAPKKPDDIQHDQKKSEVDRKVSFEQSPVKKNVFDFGVRMPPKSSTPYFLPSVVPEKKAVEPARMSLLDISKNSSSRDFSFRGFSHNEKPRVTKIGKTSQKEEVSDVESNAKDGPPECQDEDYNSMSIHSVVPEKKTVEPARRSLKEMSTNASSRWLSHNVQPPESKFVQKPKNEEESHTESKALDAKQDSPKEEDCTTPKDDPQEGNDTDPDTDSDLSSSESDSCESSLDEERYDIFMRQFFTVRARNLIGNFPDIQKYTRALSEHFGNACENDIIGQWNHYERVYYRVYNKTREIADDISQMTQMATKIEQDTSALDEIPLQVMNEERRRNVRCERARKVAIGAFGFVFGVVWMNYSLMDSFVFW